MSVVKGLIVAVLAVTAFLLYVAFLNGAFKRCPHCGKVGSWRYDRLGPPAVDEEDDHAVVRTRQDLRCRVCKRKVREVWSDFEGRSFQKMEENSEDQDAVARDETN